MLGLGTGAGSEIKNGVWYNGAWHTERTRSGAKKVIGARMGPGAGARVRLGPLGAGS